MVSATRPNAAYAHHKSVVSSVKIAKIGFPCLQTAVQTDRRAGTLTTLVRVKGNI